MISARGTRLPQKPLVRQFNTDMESFSLLLTVFSLHTFTVMATKAAYHCTTKAWQDGVFPFLAFNFISANPLSQVAHIFSPPKHMSLHVGFAAFRLFCSKRRFTFNVYYFYGFFVVFTLLSLFAVVVVWCI